MTEGPIRIDDLTQILSGDVTHMTVLTGHSQTEIVAIKNAISTEPLMVTSSAVRRVLQNLLSREIIAEQAQEWASFVRRGYIATKEKSIQPISFDYQGDREEEIVEAIARLDELGDIVDGTIDDDELRDLIERLRD